MSLLAQSFYAVIVIEFLPAELKARFLQIKEIDERVHRRSLPSSKIYSATLNPLSGQLDSLNDRTKTFFTLCRKNNKPELREQQYQNLCQVQV